MTDRPQRLAGAMSEQELETLLRQASPLPRLDPDAAATIRGSVREQWERQLRRRTRRYALAMAAGVVAVAFMVALWPGTDKPQAPRVQVASVSKILGTVTVSPVQDTAPRILRTSGERIVSRTLLSTSDASGAALSYAAGVTVRIGANTTLETVSPTRMRLLGGQVYIDTHDRGAADLTIETARGSVRHVGTRYSVALSREQLVVAVRDGRVSVGRAGEGEMASAGEAISIDGSGQMRRQSVATSGEFWQWAEALAAPFNADGRSVVELMAWVTRETGRDVRYVTEAARLEATETKLQGSFDHAPVETVTLALKTTFLEADWSEPGVVKVKLKTN